VVRVYVRIGRPEKVIWNIQEKLGRTDQVVLICNLGPAYDVESCGSQSNCDCKGDLIGLKQRLLVNSFDDDRIESSCTCIRLINADEF
jgi:hypothetical protein